MVGHKPALIISLIGIIGMLVAPGPPQVAASDSPCGEGYELQTIYWQDKEYTACMNWDVCTAVEVVDCAEITICAPEAAWGALEFDWQTRRLDTASNEKPWGSSDMECRSPDAAAEQVLQKANDLGGLDLDPPRCDTRFGTGWFLVDEGKGNGDTTIALWHDYYGGFAMTWSASQAQTSQQSDKFGMAAHLRSAGGQETAFNELQQSNPCYLLGSFANTQIKWAWIGVVYFNYQEITDGCDVSTWAEVSHTTTIEAETKATFSVFGGSSSEVSYSISQSETSTEGDSQTCGQHTTSISDIGSTGEAGEGGWTTVPKCQDSARVVPFGGGRGEASPYYFLVTYQDPDCPAIGDVEIWYDADANRKWSPTKDRKEYDTGDEAIII